MRVTRVNTYILRPAATMWMRAAHRPDRSARVTRGTPKQSSALATHATPPRAAHAMRGDAHDLSDAGCRHHRTRVTSNVQTQ